MKSPASRAAGGADRLTEHGVDNIDIAGCEDPAEVVIVGQVSTLMPVGPPLRDRGTTRLLDRDKTKARVGSSFA